MSLLEVGAENLPNVYIRSINISPTGVTNGFEQMDISIYMKDHIENPSWSDTLLEKLKIRTVIYCTGGGAMDMDSYMKFYNVLQGIDQILSYIPGTTTIGDTTIIVDDSNNLNLLYSDQEKDLKTYKHSVSYEIKTNAHMQSNNQTNLFVLTCCYYDFLDQEGITEPFFLNYHGAITAEIVYANGQKEAHLGYFYNPFLKPLLKYFV